MAVGPVPYRYNLSVDNNAEDTTDTLKTLGVTLECNLFSLLMYYFLWTEILHLPSRIFPRWI